MAVLSLTAHCAVLKREMCPTLNLEVYSYFGIFQEKEVKVKMFQGVFQVKISTVAKV
jgi:hypothetical protein